MWQPKTNLLFQAGQLTVLLEMVRQGDGGTRGCDVDDSWGLHFHRQVPLLGFKMVLLFLPLLITVVGIFDMQSIRLIFPEGLTAGTLLFSRSLGLTHLTYWAQASWSPIPYYSLLPGPGNHQSTVCVCEFVLDSSCKRIMQCLAISLSIMSSLLIPVVHMAGSSFQGWKICHRMDMLHFQTPYAGVSSDPDFNCLDGDSEVGLWGEWVQVLLLSTFRFGQ